MKNGRVHILYDIYFSYYSSFPHVNSCICDTKSQEVGNTFMVHSMTIVRSLHFEIYRFIIKHVSSDALLIITIAGIAICRHRHNYNNSGMGNVRDSKRQRHTKQSKRGNEEGNKGKPAH